jgi:uncharacterized protein DUF4136
MRTVIPALALGFALAGCATTTVDIDFDYDTGANYAALKMYRWQPATGNAAANELLVKRIRGSVDAQLAKKGRTQSDNPDFLIGMQISGKTTHAGSAAVGVSVGIPVGRAGRVSVGGARSKPIEKTEGTLVLEFQDPKTRTLVWQATASGAVERESSPEYQQQRIDGVVAQMLERFPPK